MARVLCIDDYPLYAQMVADLIARHGHDVKAITLPFALEEAFEPLPDVVVLNLVRKSEALGKPITRFEADVDGAKALHALAAFGPAAEIPLLVTALAVEERWLPPETKYEAYFEVPQKLQQLLEAIDRLATRSPAEIVPK
jgi:CheY-like chemotaxis protein